MSFRPRLVALDIDGTLVGPDERFADGVLDAVSDAVRAGARVVLATGVAGGRPGTSSRSWGCPRGRP